MACRTTVSKYHGIDVTATVCNTPRSVQQEGIYLSVIVPFYNYDIAQLFRELIDQIKNNALEVELILGDDGSADRSVYESLNAHLQDVDEACVLIRLNRISDGLEFGIFLRVMPAAVSCCSWTVTCCRTVRVILRITLNNARKTGM